jgi:hypothetical protein
MAHEPKSRRRHRKKILRKNDGSLFDVTERRPITQAELREYVRDGGLFEARMKESGADCTYEVLQSVMGLGMLQNLIPGLGGGGIPGLGGLSALGNMGNGAGGLAEIARALGDAAGRGDRGWEDWDEPSRRSQRRSEDRDTDWANRDWADKPKRPPRHDDSGWASEPGSD